MPETTTKETELEAVAAQSAADFREALRRAAETAGPVVDSMRRFQVAAVIDVEGFAKAAREQLPELGRLEGLPPSLEALGSASFSSALVEVRRRGSAALEALAPLLEETGKVGLRRVLEAAESAEVALDEAERADLGVSKEEEPGVTRRQAEGRLWRVENGRAFWVRGGTALEDVEASESAVRFVLTLDRGGMRTDATEFRATSIAEARARAEAAARREGPEVVVFLGRLAGLLDGVRVYGDLLRFQVGEETEKAEGPGRAWPSKRGLPQAPDPEGGVHAHALRRAREGTAEDGAHLHILEVLEELVLEDGEVLLEGLVLVNEEDGEHVHRVPMKSRRSATDGAHRHRFQTPGGRELLSREDGQHDHDLMVFTSAFDGTHEHVVDIPLGGGEVKTLQTSTAWGFAEARPDVLDAEVSPTAPASEILKARHGQRAAFLGGRVLGAG